MRNDLAIALFLALSVSSANGESLKKPQHTPEDKVRLSEFVAIGTVTKVTCASWDTYPSARLIQFDGPKCADDYRVEKLISVRLEEVVCVREQVPVPSEFQVQAPWSHETPTAIRERVLGRSLMFFLKRRTGPDGKPTIEPPFVIPMYDYSVEPEPRGSLVSFEGAFRKLCAR